MNSISDQTKIFHSIKKLIEIRKKQKAFHPNATSFTLQLGEKLLEFGDKVKIGNKVYFVLQISAKKFKLFNHWN